MVASKVILKIFPNLFIAELYKHSTSSPFLSLYQIFNVASNTFTALKRKIIIKLRLFFSPTYGSRSSICVAWFLDSTQSLCNILIFQRCCVGERGTFKTDTNNRVRPVVMAGDELDQMFPNRPQTVTHRWPLLPCEVAWGIPCSPS